MVNNNALKLDVTVLARLCQVLGCQVWDLLQWVPDGDELPKKRKAQGIPANPSAVHARRPRRVGWPVTAAVVRWSLRRAKRHVGIGAKGTSSGCELASYSYARPLACRLGGSTTEPPSPPKSRPAPSFLPASLRIDWPGC